MKSQRKKKLLKTIKNLAIIASITAATLKLSSFFNKKSEFDKLKNSILDLKSEIKELKNSIFDLKTEFEGHFHHSHLKKPCNNYKEEISCYKD